MRKLAVMFLLLASLGAMAQSTVTVHASKFGGTVPYTGYIYFQPHLANGQAASFKLSGGGQEQPTAKPVYVVGGTFSATLPATDNGNPQNIQYSIQTRNAAGVYVPWAAGYTTLQPHYTATGIDDWCQAGDCNLDNYVPALGALAVVVAGPAGTVSIGTTTTGAPGTAAAVSNVGTSTAALLNFVIPQGATGATGATGPQGATGSQGPNLVNATTATQLSGVLAGNGATVQTATSLQMQSAIGAGVYDAAGATSTEQARAMAAEGVNAAAAAAAQSTANAALPANGATSTGSGAANAVVFPGTVTDLFRGHYVFTTSGYPSGLGCSGSAGSYTCTAFPTAPQYTCHIKMIPGGSGGGSGANEPPGTAAFGGGAGAASGVFDWTGSCAALGSGITSPVTIFVGTGGQGGAAQCTSSSSGNAGTTGYYSSIAGAAGFATFKVINANAGSGGSTTSGNGGSATNFGMGLTFPGCAGQNSSATASPGTSLCSAYGQFTQSSTAGGGINTSSTAFAGGDISASTSQLTTAGFGSSTMSTHSGGSTCTAGASPTWLNAGSVPAGILPGIGGLGGGGCTTGNGGAGGNGTGPGGPGAGGGATQSNYCSGAGGRGADGIVVTDVY